MASAATSYEHIVLDDTGVPVVSGANTKVIEVVLHIRSSGISPEQLAVELPHLTPAQVHSAMAYYWDHRRELDEDIERRREHAERLEGQAAPPDIVDRVRQRGAS